MFEQRTNLAADLPDYRQAGGRSNLNPSEEIASRLPMLNTLYIKQSLAKTKHKLKNTGEIFWFGVFFLILVLDYGAIVTKTWIASNIKLSTPSNTRRTIQTPGKNRF